MSNQESLSVLAKLEAPRVATATGTTHILTVSLAAGSATISDPALKMHNGDSVIWDFGTLSSGDVVVINLPADLLSKPQRITGTAKFQDDILEVVGSKTVTESYTITLNGKPLTIFGLDPITPQLVIDNMGGMTRKPPYRVC